MHVDRPCTEWVDRDDRMERARRRPVALPGNGDDGRSIEKKVDEVFFSIFLDFSRPEGRRLHTNIAPEPPGDHSAGGWCVEAAVWPTRPIDLGQQTLRESTECLAQAAKADRLGGDEDRANPSG